MTHSPSFNAGNGLDNASGIATKNTSAPHNTPATRMAEREIRSAAIAARGARMSSPVLLRMPNGRGSPNEPARSSRAPRRAWSLSKIILELTR